MIRGDRVGDPARKVRFLFLAFFHSPVSLNPMKMLPILRTAGKPIVFAILALGCLALGVSCASNDGPKPPRERISQMPQNLPQSWEGQSQMGGMPTSY